jgi:hypothetical protein
MAILDLRLRAMGPLATLSLAFAFACGCGGSSAGASDAAADHSASDASAESSADASTVDSGATPNVLIADQFNNRVIEVTRQGDIVWQFGDGKSVPGPTSVVAPNDVERLPNGRTLIAGSGTPGGAGTESTCPAAKGGCPDNRVIIVDDAKGTIVWQYGEDKGGAGDGPNQLNTPVYAVLIPGAGGAADHVLITDQGNNRIIEVDENTKQIVWQFPPAPSPGDAGEDAGDSSLGEAGADAGDSSLGDTGVEDSSPGGASALNSPNSAERLASGNTLIADENNYRVIEVASSGEIVWQYPETPNPALLNVAGFASRLSDGHTLIADVNNNRIIEVTTDAKVVWTYSTASRNANMPAPNPTCGVRLKNGDTLISDQFNNQVIEVTPGMPAKVVFSYGQLGVSGNGKGQLNAPYHAVDVGDYTGLTDPND